MPITLVLPDGRTLTGGIREVIRQVLEDPALRWERPERWLGSSAIRARLRRIPGWPDCLPPAAVRWAFGFQPDVAPDADGQQRSGQIFLAASILNVDNT